MPTFKSPIYSKQSNGKGQTDVSYVFPIEYTDEDGIEFIADTESLLSVATIESLLRDNKDWWTAFLQQFLSQSVKFFSKQYTVANISKILKHAIVPGDAVDPDIPTNLTLLPKQIQIVNGVFTIHWMYTCQSLCIDIPGLSDSLPVLNKVVDGVVELSMDDLPMENPTESFDLDDPAKLYQKQKVKEAILKAKVAYYRAQNQIRTFSDKYGDNYSDSEFELEDTENESESEEDD